MSGSIYSRIHKLMGFWEVVETLGGRALEEVVGDW
jgi:hypothetical protein